MSAARSSGQPCRRRQAGIPEALNCLEDFLKEQVNSYTLKEKEQNERMRPASPMVRRKRDFFEWEFTKKMNAVGL